MSRSISLGLCAFGLLVATSCGGPAKGEIERDVARFRTVTLAEERNGRVKVESGLEGGERIVSKPPDSLQDGARVQLSRLHEFVRQPVA